MVQALQDTGFLSQGQLADYFALTRDTLPQEPWFLWYRGALWDARRFNKGSHRRHAELRAEVYCRLLPVLESWTTHWSTDDPFRPDALFTLENRPDTVALEVDTGSESHDDWRDKLARYYEAPEYCRMLVAAQGQAVRLDNLERLLAEASPVAWMLAPWDEIHAGMVWQWREPAPSPPRIRRGTASHRVTRYVLDMVPVPVSTALEGLANQRFRSHGHERMHGQDIIYLTRR